MTELLPIFPLSNVVLFPKVKLPLHIFEPRYRAMTSDALAGERRIGMVTVHPEHAGAMAGDPPVFAVGCAGAITHARRLPDGRYLLALLGIHRFRIVEEPPRPPQRPYRLARVQALGDPLAPADAPRVAALRAKVVELLNALLRRAQPGRAELLRPERFAAVDDATFVNALCQLLDLPPAEKQGLLEAEGIANRFEQLRGLLDFRLAELGGPPGSPAGAIH